MFPALKEANEQLRAKQDALAAIFAEAGPDLDLAKVKSVTGDPLEAIRALNAELDELGAKADQLREVQAAADRAAKIPAQREPGDDSKGRDGRDVEQKSLSDLFLASDAYRLKTGSVGPESSLDIDVKALMTTAAGWAPAVVRSDRVVEMAQAPLSLLDLVPVTTTGQASMPYMEETVFTNNAAEVAEGGTYPESALQLTEKTNPVRKIATWIPVTDEQLEDEPRVRGYIDGRLVLMLRQRLNTQILAGNGTAPNLRGILQTVGILTQARGTDPGPDAVYKAITKVRTTAWAEPNVVVMHPDNWTTVRLLRTTDGVYIWGSPSEAGPERIWGINVVQTPGITAATGMVGDMSQTELAFRRGIDVQISNSHSDFFVNGKQAIRADVRAGLAVYRPQAFCTVTGLL